APRPFHHGIRGRGGAIFAAALPSDERQVQADMRTHLIHRPARDIIPPLGGARVSFYWIRCCTVFMLLLWAVLGSSGTRWPSTHMRCMITANRRARATIAFFI